MKTRPLAKEEETIHLMLGVATSVLWVAVLWYIYGSDLPLWLYISVFCIWAATAWRIVRDVWHAFFHTDV